MATLNTLFDFQTPIESAASAILTANGFPYIFTSRTTGSRDITPYVDVTAVNFSPTNHAKLTGSMWYPDIWNGQLTVLTVTERALNPTSHSVNTAKVINYMMSNNLFNTQSAMVNHYMLNSTVANTQYQSVNGADDLLDGTQVTFNLTVAIRPDVWS